MLIWVFAIVLIGVALVFVLSPLLKKSRVDNVDREAQNILIAREQLAALEQGLADATIDVAVYEVAKHELEQSLASDLATVDSDVVEIKDTARSKLGVGVVAVFLPLFTLGMYMMIGSPHLIGSGVDPRSQASIAADPAEVDRILVELRAKLEEGDDPENLTGWLMLGRSYMSLERYSEAVEAYSKAHDMAPGEAKIMLPLADALAMQNNGYLEGEARELVQQVLENDPNNEMALWLEGMAAREANDYQAALTAWERLHGLLPEGSEDKKEVARLMEAIGGGIEPTVEPQERQSAEKGVGITVKVDLADALKALVDPEDTVFIYAKAMQGPPMPLAAVKKQVKDLPVTLLLDDSRAMMPQMKLSGFDKVMVGGGPPPRPPPPPPAPRAYGAGR